MLFLKKFMKSLLVTAGLKRSMGLFLIQNNILKMRSWNVTVFVSMHHIVSTFFFLSQLQTSHSPVLLTAASWVPPCWDLVEVTQTRLAHHPKCEPACSLHRCEHDQGHAVDRWHGASRGALVHLPGMHGWNWLYHICHQSSGNEQSLQI